MRGDAADAHRNNGRKSMHSLDVVYKKCPQRMLTFYEQHLVFKDSGSL